MRRGDEGKAGWRGTGETRIGCSYAKLCSSVKEGSNILVADGTLSIQVKKVLSETEVLGECLNNKCASARTPPLPSLPSPATFDVSPACSRMFRVSCPRLVYPRGLLSALSLARARPLLSRRTSGLLSRGLLSASPATTCAPLLVQKNTWQPHPGIYTGRKALCVVDGTHERDEIHHFQSCFEHLLSAKCAVCSVFVGLVRRGAGPAGTGCWGSGRT